MFIAALFTITTTWKPPSTEEWIKKKWYVHTTEYYSAIKKERNNAICINVDDIEIIILSEVSHTEKDKYHMLSLICGN